MFKRHHHQLIEQVLMRLNSEFLLKSECYFGGGTAIVLKNNEYRESVDIDFLCASKEGYRLLVNTVESNSLGEIFQNPVSLLRDVRRDQNAIRTFLTIANVPIKIEFVREARIPLSGAIDPNLHVPTLGCVAISGSGKVWYGRFSQKPHQKYPLQGS